MSSKEFFRLLYEGQKRYVNKIVKTIKKVFHKVFNSFGLEIRRMRENKTMFSNFNEQKIIYRYFKELNIKHKFCVDIGAGDGIVRSNTFFLFKDGWSGLAVEYDGNEFQELAYVCRKFHKVNLAKCKVTPENINFLLKNNHAPKEFGFLTLDIDGYDYFILEQILNSFRPSLLCIEINEKIPPPLKFTVKYDPDYVCSGDHFYGQSISQLHFLCSKHDYGIIELEYNNVFLIPKEISQYSFLSPEEAYKKGYLNRPDRKKKFPQNAELEELLGLSPYEALNFLNNFFSKYQGKFILTL